MRLGNSTGQDREVESVHVPARTLWNQIRRTSTLHGDCFTLARMLVRLPKARRRVEWAFIPST